MKHLNTAPFLTLKTIDKKAMGTNCDFIVKNDDFGLCDWLGLGDNSKHECLQLGFSETKKLL